MENFLSLMNSISDTWVSPSSMYIAMNMGIAFVCGAGLFFLLLPFLKDCPVSPPPERESDISKDVRMGQSKTRKKTATGKGRLLLSCGSTGGGKNVEETKTPSQPTRISTKQLLQDSTPQPVWNPLQNMDHLPLFQQLSYLKILEHLIWKEFSHIFWGISSLFPESVLATAHVLRNPTLSERKTVRFCDACRPSPALSQAQGQPQLSQDLPLPLKLVTPSLEGVTWFREMEVVPSSTSNQMPPWFKRRTCGIVCPTTERGTQTPLPTENQSWPHGLYWKDKNGSDIQKHQEAICKPTQTLSKGTQHTTGIRSASILPENCQITHNNEESQNEDKAPNMEEQQGTPVTLHPSRKLTQFQKHFPANGHRYYKSRPQLSQPAKPSILNSKPYKRSKMMESVPVGVPVKKDIATCDIHSTIKKGIGLGDKDVPCTSNNSPGKGLKSRNPALSTDDLSYMNPTEHHSFLDSNTERKPESSNTELPEKHRRRPYQENLEARDLTPPGVPASNVPQDSFPSSPICGSKAEYYSKAARVLENLHHQDPGGTRVQSISNARLESADFPYSPGEVQETQRTPPPAASHGPSKAQPDPLQDPQSRIIQCTGKGKLQPNTNPQMLKLPPWKRFTDVDSGQPCWRVIVIDPEENIPPAPAKQSNIVEVKEKMPPPWTVSPGSIDIHNDQAISMDPRNFGSLEADKNPGHLQTPTPQHSEDSGLKPQAYSKVDLISKEQPEAWLVKHDPDGPSTVHPAKDSLSSQDSQFSSQNTCQNTQAFQGLGDVLMKTHERVETKEISVLKDKIKLLDPKSLHHHEERKSIIRPTGIPQEESLGRVRPSIPSSTKLNDTNWIPGKGETTSKCSWKNITRNLLQHENSKKYNRQGDSLQNDNPPASAVQMQEVVTRYKAIYNMVAEIQSLMNILVQILENTEGDQTKVQTCKVESLTSQLGGSSHPSEGLYDTNHSRVPSRRSCGHAIREMHNCPFTYRGNGDELQSGIEDLRAYDQHRNQVKRGMGIDQFHMPEEFDLPCRYSSRIGDKQEPGLADKRACDLHRTKIVKGHCPHRRSEVQKHSFRYREIRDEQHPGVDHRAFDPHQSTTKGMGCGWFLSPKENHPVKHRRTDCSWPSVAAQRLSDPR